MTTKRLGRGLSSLIPQGEVKKKLDLSSVKNQIVELKTKQILLNPYQPRKNFEKSALEELAGSIKKYGLLQPLVVTKISDNEFQLLVGERRLRAAKMIGLKKVPVIIRSSTDQQKLELALVENLQRDDLNPIERAQAFQRLINEFNLTQDEVAKKINKSRAEIANTLRFLNLPQEIQKGLIDRKITAGHAKTILSLKDRRAQLKLFQQIVKGGLSVRSTEKKARQTAGKRAVRRLKDVEIIDFEERLQRALGTRVFIKKKKNQGNIIIEFYSKEELLNIVDKIAGEEE